MDPAGVKDAGTGQAVRKESYRTNWTSPEFTRGELDEIGNALYGAKWQANLCADLGITRRHMNYVMRGGRDVPQDPERRLQLRKLLKDRLDVLSDAEAAMRNLREGAEHREILAIVGQALFGTGFWQSKIILSYDITQLQMNAVMQRNTEAPAQMWTKLRRAIAEKRAEIRVLIRNLDAK